ncbi:MAG: hypothetical protein IJX99_03310 [Clostridia bacterium]|nr:hypothetical protein [Clostridia bacterium]
MTPVINSVQKKANGIGKHSQYYLYEMYFEEDKETKFTGITYWERYSSSLWGGLDTSWGYEYSIADYGNKKKNEIMEKHFKDTELIFETNKDYEKIDRYTKSREEIMLYSHDFEFIVNVEDEQSLMDLANIFYNIQEELALSVNEGMKIQVTIYYQKEKVDLNIDSALVENLKYYQNELQKLIDSSSIRVKDGQIVAFNQINVGDSCIELMENNLENNTDIHYFIDKNFNYKFKLENTGNNYTSDISKDYISIRFSSANNNDYNTYVYDLDGKEILKNDGGIDLYSNGYAVLDEHTLYNIEKQKTIYQSENPLYSYGENMIRSSDSKRVFFNTDTEQVINYPEVITNQFLNGYSVIEIKSLENEEIKYRVYNDIGTCAEITDERIKNLSWYTYSNGKMLAANIEKNKLFLVDLQTLNIIEINYNFKTIVNKPQFSKDGYAVIVFTNMNEEYYYVVIDSNGDFQFTPTKMDSKKIEIPQLTRMDMMGKYFIISYKDEEVIYDNENNFILKSEKYENYREIYEDIILVKYDNSLYESMYETLYYLKDMNGNVISYGIK